ncbi:hypothetical protein EA472_10990 [Natrarchaeobius oligotrophus]|uniref:Uncharacterized protein n=1 Tax=Natrarchaeobius chitinivorans TaxID=1679083 RepID=A0A3N6M9H2_NATCH|nr:hypothetical protein EA472_10990 [Natrarchaeobius chitinivorans]
MTRTARFGERAERLGNSNENAVENESSETPARTEDEVARERSRDASTGEDGASGGPEGNAPAGNVAESVRFRGASSR